MANLIRKMEEAAGILPEAEATTKTQMPYGPGERIPQGGKARPWTGPKPWAEQPGSLRSDEPASGGYEHNSPAKPL